jgi:hypothetical protein
LPQLVRKIEPQRRQDPLDPRGRILCPHGTANEHRHEQQRENPPTRPGKA